MRISLIRIIAPALLFISCSEISEKPVEQHAFKAAEKARRNWLLRERLSVRTIIPDTVEIKTRNDKDTINNN